MRELGMLTIMIANEFRLEVAVFANMVEVANVDDNLCPSRSNTFSHVSCSPCLLTNRLICFTKTLYGLMGMTVDSERKRRKSGFTSKLQCCFYKCGVDI